MNIREMERKQALSIGNGLFAIYMLYILFIINTEWINFLLWCVDIDSFMYLAEVISLLILSLIIFFLHNKVKLEKIEINIEIVIGIVLILLWCGLTSVYPDETYDTFNYHLIAQNPKFENYFVDDFGYGNFQVWGFRLCDRMFYYFRYFLGYRLGTLLNAIPLVISFVQIYGVLNELVKNKTVLCKIVCNRLVWSFAIIFSLQALMMCGTYYVDVLMLPIGIEVVKIVVNKYEEDVTAIDIAYFALLNGIWIGAKMTNVVFVLPCVICFIMEHYKVFKIKNWIIAILNGLYPFLTYVIFNWLCTGNPVFPYFNNIFKSDYFPAVNFKDTRWGGKTVFEKVFWILYAAFIPEYRQSEIYDKRNAVLIIGIIGTIILLLIGIVKRIKYKKAISKRFLIFVLITTSSSLLWAFTTGYSRYYIFGRLLWGILAFVFVLYVFEKKFVGFKFLASGATCVAIVCVGLNVVSFTKGVNWSFRIWSIDSFIEQAQEVFTDNDIKKNFELDADLFVLTDYMSMGIAELVDDKTFSIYTNYSSRAPELYKSILEDKLESSQKIYDIHSREFSDIYDYIELLNTNGLYIVGMESVDISIGEYEMVLVEKSAGRLNEAWTSLDNPFELDVSDKNGEVRLSFIGGRVYDWNDEAIKITIKVSDGQSVREISSVELDNKEIRNYSIPLTLNEKDCTIIISACYVSGEVIADSQVDRPFCINPVVE